MNKRVSKQLNNSYTFNKIEDISSVKITEKNIADVLLSIDEKDITASFVMTIFGEFNGKSICNPYDTLLVPKGLYHGNKNNFITTAGCWVYNKFFIDKDLFGELGYINKTINKKVYNYINQKLSYAVMEDRITTKELARFLNKTMLVMQFETILSPNHSEEMLTCSKKIAKKKDELFKQYVKEIEEGDVATVSKIEKELLDYAKELIGDDPSYDIYDSGASGVWGNDFKNMYVSYGVVRNADPNAKHEYDVVKSNFMDGINPEEYAVVANSLIGGPYSRGKKTALGGYWEKLLISACQDAIAGPDGSDCGTDKYITVNLTKDNINSWIYSYIVSGSSLIELTSKNMDKYIGKTVKFRYSGMCKSKDYICSKCLGNYFYRVGVKNVGILTAQIASSLKLKSMKAFHNSVISTIPQDKVDLMRMFSLK